VAGDDLIFGLCVLQGPVEIVELDLDEVKLALVPGQEDLKPADLAAVNAVSSATTLGFRNTIRDAVANVVAKAGTFSGSGTGSGEGTGTGEGSGTGSYKVDGYDKKYSYTALNSGKYYFLYRGTYYPVKGLKYYSKDKKKNYYCGYFEINGVKYYLDKTPQPYTSRQLSKEHPGDDSASKAYESCKQEDVRDGEELPLYIK